MVVVAQQIGRLGNMLQLFTHLIALSRDQGVRVAHLGFTPYAPLFEGTHADLFCRYPPARSVVKGDLPRKVLFFMVRVLARMRVLDHLPGCAVVRMDWRQGDCSMETAEFLRLARSRRFVFLLGGWRFRYWRNYRENLGVFRGFFRPVPRHASRVRSLMEALRKSGDVVIGVHIRQTDIRDGSVRDACKGFAFFETPQYVAVMKRLVGLFEGKRVVFLVCSDESQDPSHFEGLSVRFGPGHFIEDMYALAECDYLVATAGSSFSGWASLVGNKPLHSLKDPEAPIGLGDFFVYEGG